MDQIVAAQKLTRLRELADARPAASPETPPNPDRRSSDPWVGRFGVPWG